LKYYINITKQLEKICILLYTINMKKMNKFRLKQIIYAILVVIWAIIVFSFSNQVGNDSKGLSEKVAEKLIDMSIDNKYLSGEEKQLIIDKWNVQIRKLSHFMIYFIGGILIINFAITLKIKPKSILIYSIVFGLMYASSDEMHQFFVSGRKASIVDVIIDTFGVITGVFIFWLTRKFIYK
jgi:Predicted integral membrane protein